MERLPHEIGEYQGRLYFTKIKDKEDLCIGKLDLYRTHTHTQKQLSNYMYCSYKIYDNFLMWHKSILFIYKNPNEIFWLS